MNIADLRDEWDLVVVGGGITGAGILLNASRMGLKALLVERNDFASGTSSRSSKLVHGGLRYLKEGRLYLTYISVRERERLIREGKGLVEPIGFMTPVYGNRSPGRLSLEAGLRIYDFMSHRRDHKFYGQNEFSMRVPGVKQENLLGGFYFRDAQVDDARLVLRVIKEALLSGGCAINYAGVTEISRNARGDVAGVVIQESETGETKQILTRAVINATGSWAEKIHPSPDQSLHLRPLKGSHLVFPGWAFPFPEGITFFHPADRRPIFIIPWEGAVIYGTTDVDHKNDISLEPVISNEEISYLMDGLNAFFPSLEISINDALSSYAGIRPVLSRKQLAPSKESREHVVWINRGLVTITGGKLTTFRKLAADALKAAMPFLPQAQPVKDEETFKSIPENIIDDRISPLLLRRLTGRYGEGAKEILKDSEADDLSFIPGTTTVWAEIRYAAKHEAIRHLEDLLLRRVRIGLITPGGGKEHLGRIRKLCAPVLPWDEGKWDAEINMYLEKWRRAHSVA
ncbi:MAG: glycerol-3-phosphate dehydrogenase/oxidase [Proteobacteria bacterium]|nr:glycerol-3-phosphate dehydrogenase/oxidase [Pseudomonadota bacterium]